MRNFHCNAGLQLLRVLTLTIAMGGGESCLTPADAAENSPPVRAQSFRRVNQPVIAQGDGNIVCEAEEFAVTSPGWQAKPWGTNYYAATFANSFLSRKAYLGAPEQADRSVATIEVQVPKAGKYAALVRYEAAYRFETQFRLQVHQNNSQKLDRLYGARENPKIWAFRQKLQKEVSWPWGAVENVVWEGHDAFVDLEVGTARLTLIADKQSGDAARRNVDLVLLTSDLDQVKKRIEEENYLPLDGLLTQSGDVYLKLQNSTNGPAMTLTAPPGTEHSPYWVHQRTWKPIVISAKPGETTEWIEVGSNLDSLNDGQWTLTAKSDDAQKPTLDFSLEFGVRDASGKIATIQKLEHQSGNITLAYDADTRYSRQIRSSEQVLFDLVAYLKGQPVQGIAPKRTLIYGATFEKQPGRDAYNTALDEFVRLMGATALTTDPQDRDLTAGSQVRGYVDVRGQSPLQLEVFCQKLKTEGKANKIAIVSLGDEIGLGSPPAADHAAFREWLKSRKLLPADVDPDAADNWDKILYSPDKAAAERKPGLYYYSQLYRFRYGIRQQKSLTDVLQKHLPHAGIGANSSPHHGHLYMGETHHWISVFREEGMTMPWGEDYIWQVPVGTQQMNTLAVDMFRAAITGKRGMRIHYYVMPHTPGNTPDSWRRQFYGTLAHGAKIVNLFEFRPVQAAYTENHTTDPAMYHQVRTAFHELGKFEDLLQDSRVFPAQAGLWFSEASDVWNDQRAPFDVAKRTLYIAIRQQQIPLDVVVEGDDLRSYKVLYLTDQHVSRAASQAIAAWVKAGGQLLATAGAGMYDEFNQLNKIMRELLHVDQAGLDAAPGEPVRFEKQDLAFAEVMDTVREAETVKKERIPVIGIRSQFEVEGADVIGEFADGQPAVTTAPVERGRVTFLAFLPGLSYFKPAMPRRPADRGATNDSMAHFIPTEFDAEAAKLIAQPAQGLSLPVVCVTGSPAKPAGLVETTVLQAPQGFVVPVINWSGKPIPQLSVNVNFLSSVKSVNLASGKPVKFSGAGSKLVFTFDLDVADSLILK
jgi:hypothetical protein